MMKNPVQFQKGLGLLEFLAQYSDEEKCRDALLRLRWPSGFVCPECGGHSHCELKSRRLYQCNVSFRQSCVDLQIRSAMMHGRGTGGLQEN